MPTRSNSAQAGESNEGGRLRSSTQATQSRQSPPESVAPSPPPRHKRDSGILADILNQIKELRNDFDTLKGRVSNIEGRMTDVERDRVTHRALDQEVSVLVSRLETSEREIRKIQDKMMVEFDPQVTIVAQGLPVSPNEDMITQAKTLVNRALNEPDVPVIRATRLPSRNNRPGLVKIEVDSLDSKLKLLRKKFELKETENYKNVFLRSSKSHTERLLEINILKLLDEIPNGKTKYKLTSNGRLVERNRDESGFQRR